MQNEFTEVNRLKSIAQTLERTIDKLTLKTLEVGGYINQDTLCRFLNYSRDRVRRLEKEGLLKSEVFLHRKFYKVVDVIKLIQNNTKKQ
jgi:hypothetical protein